MNWIFLILLPFMTAFIGWITNLVAIKMLFRPMRPVSIFGYTWQGMIPKRQKDLAHRAAGIVERELLDRKLIEEHIRKVDLKPFLRNYAHNLVYEGLGEKLRSIPLLGAFIDATTLQRLEALIASEMQKKAEPFLRKMATEVETHIPVRLLVEEKIASLELDKLEQIVHQVARREFRSIELLGGLLGFLVGLLQLLVLLLTGNLDLAAS